jgi:hypothetical protein
MNRIFIAIGVILAALLACGPVSASLKNVEATVTTFVDPSGMGVLPEVYQPLPNTLVVAKWNHHGSMYREVKLTDQNGQADFSVGYTHFFDVSVFPPCGYYSTTPLFRDMTGADGAEFGFWPAIPDDRPSRVKVMVWEDINSNGNFDPRELDVNEKASVMFKIPGGAQGNVFNQDNFLQESSDGWFDINLGNSCGAIYMLLLNSDLETGSVSEPGKESDAGAHGNTFYPSIEIPYGPGETTVYWEMR